MSKPDLKQVKKSPVVATYIYNYANGEKAFEKLRRQDKSFFFRRWDQESGAWKYSIKGLDTPLYNEDKIKSSKIICVCEGEKDCDTLTQYGYTAVTNLDGAGKWKDSYTQALVGKKIIIFTDNDEPGRKHGQLVARKLLGHASDIRIVDFPDLPEHGDVTDYLASGNLEGLKEKVNTCSPYVVTPEELAEHEALERQENSQAMGEEALSATYEDFKELFYGFLKNPKVDIFTNKLMSKDRKNMWQMARNSLGRVRSEAMRREQSGGLKYNRALFDDHLDTFESELEPQFLVEIPEWDGKDRILLFANAVVLNEGDVTQEHFLEFLKDWLSKAFQKLVNPYVQNRILILKGTQGLGKDTWMDHLLAGAGQFFTNMNVVGADKDTFLHLHRGLFVRIAEFEKAAKTEVSVIKDMITTPNTFIRAPYDAEPRHRDVLCSFISNSNISDILRDPTGSRRYLVFDVNHVEWTYPQTKQDSLQVLAQAKMLADVKFKASSEAEKAMKAYLDIHTPDDPADDVLELYSSMMEEALETLPLNEIGASRRTNQVANHHCIEVINKVCKLLDMRSRTVRIILKANGYGWENKNGMRGRGFHVYHPSDHANVNRLKGEVDRIDYESEEEEMPF
jgi:hypothetical protein